MCHVGQEVHVVSGQVAGEHVTDVVHRFGNVRLRLAPVFLRSVSEEREIILDKTRLKS